MGSVRGSGAFLGSPYLVLTMTALLWSGNFVVGLGEGVQVYQVAEGLSIFLGIALMNWRQSER